MKMVIGIALIIGAVCLGYFGVKKWDDSSKSVSIGKLELSADKTSGKNEAYFYLGGAVVLLIGGVIVLRK